MKLLQNLKSLLKRSPRPPLGGGMNDKIVLGIPGAWSSRSDLVTAIASSSSGYLFAGRVLMEVATSKTCELEIYEHDPGLRRTFQIAGNDHIGPDLLDRIAEHTMTAYLIGADLSQSGVAQMRQFAAALIRSGGMAVKIESTGVAHTPERWLQDIEDQSIEALYALFHTYVGSSDYYYSCGMKNFGLPDCSMDGGVPSDVAAEMMHLFNYYQLTEAPTFKDGNTFSVGEDEPKYRLTWHPYGYESDSPLDNPFGRWHMSPAV